jgi:predicted secreted hydrolase
LLLLSTPVVVARPATPVAGDAPVPVEFPRDDGIHDSRIEWWYFTGHLFSAEGERYGFEYVIFRARPGDLEGYVSHFAITDNPRGLFRYDQRLLGAKGVAGTKDALDLDLDGWTMRGGDGHFSLAAEMPGYALHIDVAATKPAALHDGDAYIDYGNGTGSHYYSWTRMTATGTLDLGDRTLPVTGEAWMDHQWGNFQTYQSGGWDWFSLQLEDGTDVMLYLIRDPLGKPFRVDGSIVAEDGELTLLGPGDFDVQPTGEWTSPESGAVYPSGWTITIPETEMALTVMPAMTNQELDTRQTTGVIYWEGEVHVDATIRDEPVAGYGYVELTGYAPYEPLDLQEAMATPVS